MLHDMTPAVAGFIAFKIVGSNAPLGNGLLAGFGHGPMVAMCRMEMVVHAAMEVFRTMKPRSSANENAIYKPFRSIVAGRSAGVGGNVIVTIRTVRGHADFDADLGLSSGSDSSNHDTNG